MTGHHTAHTAILSEVGDKWVSSSDLADKLNRWTRNTIFTELHRMAKSGLIVRSMEVRERPGRPGFWFWTSRYTRRRDPLDAMNMIVPGMRPFVLASLAEVFGG